MSMQSLELKKIIDQDNMNRSIAKNKLDYMCELSDRLKYEDLVERLLDITEHKISLESYKMTNFKLWLADDLEYCQIVNSPGWDMTITEIDREFGNDEYWKTEFIEYKKEYGGNGIYETLEEFKGSMMDWSYTHSLNAIFSELRKEYLWRKEQGLID